MSKAVLCVLVKHIGYKLSAYILKWWSKMVLSASLSNCS